eukprot:IDg2181t1
MSISSPVLSNSILSFCTCNILHHQGSNRRALRASSFLHAIGRGKAWDADDNSALARSGISASEDPVVGADQKSK